MTWITLTSLMFLSFMPLMQFMSTASSVDSPYNRPFCSQEVSRTLLPESPATDLLTKMLVPAPYKVPKKTDSPDLKSKVWCLAGSKSHRLQVRC